MTDIVNRLRGSDAGRREMLEAADEIDRLRAALLKIDRFIAAITPKPTKEHAAICQEIHHVLEGAP